MVSNTRSYTLIRTLILGSATLAIVGVLFAVYQSISGNPPVQKTQASNDPLEEVPTRPVADTNDGQGVEVAPEIELGPGSKGSISLYDADSDLPKAVVTYLAWNPVSGADKKFHVTEPEISLRTPDGQLVEIRARSGLVQLKEARGDRFELRSGQLVGDVVIEVDRLDEQQRADLPPERRDRPGPERLIVLRLDEVDFDLEYAHVESSGPFRLESAEFDIEGQGLNLRYNEADSSIKDLRTARAGKITVRGLGTMFRVAMPGQEDQTVEPSPAEGGDLKTAAPPTAAPTELPDDGIPVLALDAPEEKTVRPAVTYRAQFTGDVEVLQTEAGQSSGTLAADVVELLFQFGQTQREAARVQAAAPTRGEGDDGPNGPDTQTTQPADDGVAPAVPPTVLTVNWSGPLVIKAVDAQEADAAPPIEETGTQVTATGEAVRLTQATRGTLDCTKLVYHEKTEQAWLYGTVAAPVIITAPDGGRLEGPEVVLDMSGGAARITGPGRLLDKGPDLGLEPTLTTGDKPSRGAEIRFRDQVDATFAEIMIPGEIDTATGQPIEKRRRYLQRAVFSGQVSMRQAGDSIAGERIEVAFDPPRAAGSMADNMRRLLAEGDVRLIHGDETVACGRLDVEMGLDESGRVAPRLARAYEQVTATQQGRTITASERMNVHLRSFRQERPPFDLAKARVEAAARGHDPDTLDWDKIQSDYESSDSFRPGLLRLDAYGDVVVRDPQQKLAVDAAALECTFRDGRQIDTALVTGTEAAPASVELDDFSIGGREVEIDGTGQAADAPGRGRMTFLSIRDLDGRQRSDAILVAITWSEDMVFRG
ncbi:MAG: hypothetical protein GY778_28970, partial [bacterium]|nr:hypothetical protein [bacterium]